MFRVHIADHECGLLFRNRRFVRCLPPGCHRLWRPLRDRVEKVNRLEPLFRHPAMECLLRDPFLQSQLELVCLEPTQRALVWKRGRLACVAGPGQHAFWAEPDGLILEVHDVREARLVHPRLDEVARLAPACTLFSVVNVARHERLLVFEAGIQVERLDPGTYVFWQGAGPVRWKVIAEAPAGAGCEGPNLACDAVSVDVSVETETGHTRALGP